jgi:hypothetical protein
MSTDFSSYTAWMTSNLSPSSVWSAYLNNLVRYSSTSWVARIASTFRILAFLVIVPLAFLASLDIASYVIARTLGVIDDSKASTSDNATIHKTSSSSDEELPSIVVSTDPLTPTSETSSFRANISSREKLALSPDAMPNEYFAADENGLSGAGIFSPATSQPPSPTMSRHHCRDDSSSVSSLSGRSSPTLSRRQLKEDQNESKLSGSTAVADPAVEDGARRRKA